MTPARLPPTHFADCRLIEDIARIACRYGAWPERAMDAAGAAAIAINVAGIGAVGFLRPAAARWSALRSHRGFDYAAADFSALEAAVAFAATNCEGNAHACLDPPPAPAPRAAPAPPSSRPPASRL